MGVAHLADNRHTKPFLLAGGKPDEQSQRGFGFGALIHGFSSGVLSRAWELDKSSVRDVLEGQSGVGIVKVDEDITFPDATNAFDRSRSIPTFASKTVERSESSAATSFLFYEPWDLGAMVAPNWFHGSHQILYVVHGRGRIEVVDPSGERVLDAELEQGSLVVVPAFYPSSEESFHYITFVTSHSVCLGL
ncbi:13S globulin basic chain isoform X3 [Selaginella moellendorffii]|uniref:13S globulin basic chain isoform X3 n=1 Tax=Selaginella moellendorffii TaxID=88036 RepID=UPI000D1D03E8|nr:13S globulin basic chain isoform X3 [Selaginella moellendorffii]|eukprot:XP_024528575.1 13S globulin basic chain isoform X3 [Selaginella moellendorffii]